MNPLRLKLLILLTFISLNSRSQINSNYFPVLPDTVLMSSQDGNLQYNLGGNGTGQSWNFSQFIGTDIDTVGFTNLATTGYESDYPTAEIHQDENVSEGSFALTTFFDLQPEGAYQVAQILGSPGTPIPVEFAEPILWLPFPSSLGTYFQDTVWMTTTIDAALVEIPADSARFERTVYRTDTIGASGSLLLSSGYHPNVLRKTTTDLWYDTIYSYTAANGWELLQTDSRESETHYWIDPTTPFALAEMYFDDGEPRGMRTRPFDPGPISYYLEIVGISPILYEDVQHPPFTVNIRNVSNNLIASGYATDSIRITGAGNINGSLAEWAVGGTATFDSVFFHNGGDFQILAYGFECLTASVDVHVIGKPDSLNIVGLQSSVNRTETINTFEVHAFDTNTETAQLAVDWVGNVSIGKKSGAGGISGTVSKPLVNGVATFDDLSFNFADDYELVAYFIDIEIPDTALISVIPDAEGEWLFSRVDTLSHYLNRATWFSALGGFQGSAGGPSKIPIWTEIGQHFDFDGSGRVTEVMIHVSSHDNVGTDEDSIRVNIYDAGVNQLIRTDANPSAPLDISYVDSLAKHLLGSTYIREDSLLTMYASQFGIFTPLKWPLDEPIEVHGPFVMTVQLNYENGVNDTLIIWHSEIGDGMEEHRASRRVVNNESGFVDGEWLPEYMAQAFTQVDYDYMFEPIVEVDSFQVVPVGITSIEVRDELRIYPNLARESITITGYTFIPVSITVLDMLGNIVFVHPVENKKNGSPIWLSIGQLSAGSYIVNIRGENEEGSSAFGRFSKY